MFQVVFTVLQDKFDKYHQKVYVKMVSTLNLEEKYNRGAPCFDSYDPHFLLIQ